MCKFADNEGKELDIILRSGEVFRGLVVGCDPNIGITIVEKDNKNHYILCAHGMSSPVTKKLVKNGEWSTYNLEEDLDDIMDIVMDGIEQGLLDIDASFGDIHGNAASSESCSFM